VIRKVVILARGLGTRMQKEDQSVALDESQAQAARRGLKALIPLANGRVFLDYLLSSVADAGYSEVCLVVAPEHEELRRRYQQEMPLRRLSITFAVQEKPLGTANAVAAAEEFAGGDDFIMINSDNYYPVAALTGLRELKGAGVALFDQDTMLARSNIAAERIKAFAVGLVERDGRLVRILEKPTADVLSQLPRPLWLSMNCWRFRPSIFEACRRIDLSPRGEYEITDAVQYAIDRLGEEFRAVLVREPVFDMTSRSDIPSMAARLADVSVEL